MVELMCNGTFEDKDPNEAMEYLDLLAENAQNWDTTCTMRHQVKPNLIYLVEVCTTLGQIMTSKHLREDHDLQAKFASLARKVEALKLKKEWSIKICSRHCVLNM